ncbi:MAG: cadherin repeat domain-containing protein [Marinagarivorans sp.]
MRACLRLFLAAQFCCLSLLCAGVALIAGCGGAGISFANQNVKVTIDENKDGTVWIAKATPSGRSSVITYTLLPGKDGELFKIDETTGALSFKQPPDFETPLDVQHNNSYEVDIQASAQVEDTGSEANPGPGHFVAVHAQQVVLIQVKDVSNPILTVISPLHYENVGDGTPVAVELSVKWFDAEDNHPVQGDGVMLNGEPMQQDMQDPLIWRAQVSVPAGGTILSTIGYVGVTPKIRVLTQVFNKPGAINPSFMVVYPGKYLFIFDPLNNRTAKIDLATNHWLTYVNHSLLGSFARPVYDFNTYYGHIYTVLPSNALIALDVSKDLPGIFYAGAIANVVGIKADTANKRVILLSKTPVSGVDQYRLMAVPVEQDTEFVKPKTEYTQLQPADTTVLWDIPHGVLQGTFKYFNYHRASKTYIFADERTLAGKTSTTIQGFNEDGTKRFEAVVGPDISNLAVNNKGAQLYVAENHSTHKGRLKAIDINTGEVTDLVQSFNGSTIGAYSSIYMDVPYQRLYIGDDVSDSVFSLDLSTNVLSDLSVTEKPYPTDVE